MTVATLKGQPGGSEEVSDRPMLAAARLLWISPPTADSRLDQGCPSDWSPPIEIHTRRRLLRTARAARSRFAKTQCLDFPQRIDRFDISVRARRRSDALFDIRPGEPGLEISG